MIWCFVSDARISSRHPAAGVATRTAGVAGVAGAFGAAAVPAASGAVGADGADGAVGAAPTAQFPETGPDKRKSPSWTGGEVAPKLPAATTV